MSKEKAMKKDTNSTEVEAEISTLEPLESSASQILDLSAQIEALEGRLSALENKAESIAPEVHDGRARIMNAEESFASPSLPNADSEAMARYQALQESRASKASERASRRGNQPDFNRLQQLTRELEQRTWGEVSQRLSNLQQSGHLREFVNLPMGASRPGDYRSDRVLVTTDSNGIVISAEIG